MTPETLARLEKMYAEVWPSASAEIYQEFPAIAAALKEAWARLVALQQEQQPVAEVRNALLEEMERHVETRDALEAARFDLIVARADISFLTEQCLKLAEDLHNHRAIHGAARKPRTPRRAKVAAATVSYAPNSDGKAENDT